MQVNPLRGVLAVECWDILPVYRMGCRRREKFHMERAVAVVNEWSPVK